MSWPEAIVLAVIQGLTEFIPVSSSGHLVLAQGLFGTDPGNALAYDLVLHLGTACAALLFYRRDVAALLRGALPPYAGAGPERAAARRLLLLLAVASLPTAVIGFAFQDPLEALFESPRAAALGLLCTGGVLVAVSRLAPREGALGRAPWWKGALVGLAQGAAIVPGVSRSGSTIAAGLAVGLRRDEAVRFSFLLSLPAIAGASLLELRHLEHAGRSTPAQHLAGFVAAAAVGYLSIAFVLRWTRRGRLWQFGLYCWVVAALALAALAQG